MQSLQHIFKGFEDELNTLNMKIETLGMECQLQIKKSSDILFSLNTELLPYIMKRDEYIRQLQQEVEHDIVRFTSKKRRLMLDSWGLIC